MDTVGIVADGVGAALAATFERAAAGCGPEVVVSPPVFLEELARSCPLIVVMQSEDESRATLARLRGVVRESTVVVSTCPVLSLDVMRLLAGPTPSLARAAIVSGAEPGEGAAAVAVEPGTAGGAVERLEALMRTLGEVEIVGEETLDAVVALAAGGQAFVCEALVGMQEGATKEGLPPETARSFTYQTALATALLLRDHHGSPADLKDQVASPGGTTIAALAALEDAGVRGAFLRAVQRSAVNVRARRDAGRPGVVE